MDTPATPKKREGQAMAGMILGIVGLIFWLIPLFGAPITIVGLVLSLRSLDSTRRGNAIAGVVMNIIGLVLTVLNAAWGAYLGATGQHTLLQ